MNSHLTFGGLPPGQFLYEIVYELGHGGLGIVEAARVTQSNCAHPVGRELARKRLHPKWSAEPSARERFDREVALLRKLKHPNIVTLEGENLPGGERVYFMPLYPSTLRKQLESGRRYSVVHTVAIGIVLANALDHAHRAGFLHRDLKPDNILLDAWGTCVLCDWGLGQFVHRHSQVLDLTKAGLGTQHYCAPEQWENGHVDERADVYSLGMTLAELAGYDLRRAVPAMGIRVEVVRPRTVAAQLFNRLVQDMTQIVADRRPATMADAASRLHAIANLG